MNAAKQNKYYAIVDQKNELFTLDEVALNDAPDKMQIYSNKKEALKDAAYWNRLEHYTDVKYSVIEVSFGKKVKK